jgi:hypothetical protein
MARKHYTALGELIDMNAIAAKHANTIAIGNASMNARGDIVNNSGVVLRTQEQIEDAWKKEKESKSTRTGTSISPDIKAPLPDSVVSTKNLDTDQDFDPELSEKSAGNDTVEKSSSGRRRKMIESDE